MKIWVSNQMNLGLQAWDGSGPPASQPFGLEYPPGSGIEHLFGAGPVIGVLADGVAAVAQAYRPESAEKFLLPDPGHPLREKIWWTSIGVAEPNRRGFDDDGDGKIDEDDLDGLDNDGDWDISLDDIGADGIPDTLEVGCKGSYDRVLNPDPAYDNFDPATFDVCHPDSLGALRRMNDKDLYTEKNGIPDHGEPHVDEDFGAVSQSDYYCVATDTVPVVGHVPIGVKVIQKSYAWFDGQESAIILFDYDFVNIGNKMFSNGAAGMCADMDVGPPAIQGYSGHNYAAYDSATKTAYVHNPIDRGSTPLGLTLLGIRNRLDSLHPIFRWSDYVTNLGPGTDEGNIYRWMRGSTGPAIMANQPVTSLSDTRVYLGTESLSLYPGDTAGISYAFVSGGSISEMLDNARRAQRIYDASGFTMPRLSIADSGGGHSVQLSWHGSGSTSPFGNVVSYRLYYGTAPGLFSDSIDIAGEVYTFNGLPGQPIHYFALAGIDATGRLSALSDEVSTAPFVPSGFLVRSGEKSIVLSWIPHVGQAPDIAGINVYRRQVPDTFFTRLNVAPVTDSMYVDSTVRGNTIYYYRISAIDWDGNESPMTAVQSGSLIPPAAPTGFIVAPRPREVDLFWSPNSEPDLAGYNIYRQGPGDSTHVRINSSLWTSSNYRDSIVSQNTSYSYYLVAVDTTGTVSLPTVALEGHTVARDQGVLVLNRMGPPVAPDVAASFYDYLLADYLHAIVPRSGGVPQPNLAIPSTVYKLAPYSTVFLLQENPLNSPLPPALTNYPIALKAYLLSGGKLAVMGRRMTQNSGSYWLNFLADYFLGTPPLLDISSTVNFVGATGLAGFPTVTVDSVKAASGAGRLGYVERLVGAPPERIIYQFVSDPHDSTMEGNAVGVRAIDSTFQAYYMSFPLYGLDTVSARLIVKKILDQFGELTGVENEKPALPTSFRMEDAYPNPFNPSTTIRYGLPARAAVEMTIFNILGQRVATLFEGVQEPGFHSVVWSVAEQPSGVYFVRLTAQSVDKNDTRHHNFTQKVVLMK